MFVEPWSSDAQKLEVDGFGLFAFHRELKNARAWRPSGGFLIYAKNHIYKFLSVYKFVKEESSRSQKLLRELLLKLLVKIFR